MHIDIDLLYNRIPPGARVLDLGGWHKVFPRANVVVDLAPYATRNCVYPNLPEYFNEESWIIADFCSPSFWASINDKEFDFVTIGHTLEDVRDPLFVCQQMIRTSKAGYIEVPSKFRECSKINVGDSFSGFDHHRWLVEPMKDLTGLIFKAKLSWAHHEDFLGEAHRHLVNDYFMQFDGYFWTESFKYVEHFPKGTVAETIDLRKYFERTINSLEHGRQAVFDLVPDSYSNEDGKCLWVDEYLLARAVSCLSESGGIHESALF